MIIQTKLSTESVNTPKVIVKILNEILKSEDAVDQDKEHLWTIGLDVQNRIKYIELVHLGWLDGCPAVLREIFRTACIQAVRSIIVAHNHPSSNPTPSMADRLKTMALYKAGELLSIPLTDHVIIAGDNYYSFADDGALERIRARG